MSQQRLPIHKNGDNKAAKFIRAHNKLIAKSKTLNKISARPKFATRRIGEVIIINSLLGNTFSVRNIDPM